MSIGLRVLDDWGDGVADWESFVVIKKSLSDSLNLFAEATADDAGWKASGGLEWRF